MEKKTSNIDSSEVSGNKKKTEIKRTDFPLAKINFVLMMACGVLIVAGFLLMLGGSNNGTEFNDDIFGFRRVVVGPTMAFIGFVAMGVAIIFKKK